MDSAKLGAMSLWPSPWPAEDGGPTRSQAPSDARGLAIGHGERLVTSTVRDALASTMVVSREPGEVFVLRHTLRRRPLVEPSTCWVEQVDPRSLRTLARSRELPGGPFWPGGLAAHADGSLHVVFGRHCHRLSPDLEVLASLELPVHAPYNSFVVLGDGTLAMKDLDRTLGRPARLTLLDPATLERRCPDLELPESVVARLSADGEHLYAVGAGSVHGLRWDGRRLHRELEVRYLERGGQSYGWDPVIAAGHIWFLDNGAHDYSTTMLGAGIAAGPVHLTRISIADPADREAVEICGLPRGAVTDPPLYDPQRRIAIGYDSANGVLAAFSFDGRLERLWQRPLAHAAHMIIYPDTGELVVGDWSGPALSSSRLARAVGPWAGWVPRSRMLRAGAARAGGDDVVVLDIATGTEMGRTRVPSMFQSVLFPAPGWGRDLYWCTFSTVARIEVAPAA